MYLIRYNKYKCMTKAKSLPLFQEGFSINIIFTHCSSLPWEICTLHLNIEHLQINDWLTDGSHWNRNGLSLSHPHISKDTPNGRTPLQKAFMARGECLCEQCVNIMYQPRLCVLLHDWGNLLHQLRNWDQLFESQVILLCYLPCLCN